MHLKHLFVLLVVLPIHAMGQQTIDVTDASIMDLQNALESGSVTSVDLVAAYLDRIDAYDRQGPMLNSLVRTNPRALEIAEELDEERRTRGARGPLRGIPVIVGTALL